MAAQTNRKTAMSIKKAQLQREPEGRCAVGGSGVVCETVEASAVTGRSSLGKSQFAGFSVVVEDFRVASPLDRGFQLAAGFLFTELFIKQVAEEFFIERTIGLGLERLLDLTEQGNVGESCFAKDGLARLNIGAGKFVAQRSDDGVAFFHS